MKQIKKTERNKATIRIMAALLIMVSVYFLAYQRVREVSSDQIISKKKPCVVIDAGHGGGNLR